MWMSPPLFLPFSTCRLYWEITCHVFSVWWFLDTIFVALCIRCHTCCFVDMTKNARCRSLPTMRCRVPHPQRLESSTRNWRTSCRSPSGNQNQETSSESEPKTQQIGDLNMSLVGFFDFFWDLNHPSVIVPFRSRRWVWEFNTCFRHAPELCRQTCQTSKESVWTNSARLNGFPLKFPGCPRINAAIFASPRSPAVRPTRASWTLWEVKSTPCGLDMLGLWYHGCVARFSVSWDLLEGCGAKKMGNGIDHGEISRFYDGTVQRDMQKWNACQVSSKATVPRPG